MHSLSQAPRGQTWVLCGCPAMQPSAARGCSSLSQHHMHSLTQAPRTEDILAGGAGHSGAWHDLGGVDQRDAPRSLPLSLQRSLQGTKSGTHQRSEAKLLMMTQAESPEPAALHACHSTGESLAGCRVSKSCTRLPAMWHDDTWIERWACGAHESNMAFEVEATPAATRLICSAGLQRCLQGIWQGVGLTSPVGVLVARPGQCCLQGRWQWA